MTDAAHAALMAIVGGVAAWTEEGLLVEAGHAVETLEALAVDGLAVRWEIVISSKKTKQTTRRVAWTLTPWGEWTAAVRVVEKKRREPSTVKRRGGRVVVVKGKAIDSPHWADGRFDMESEAHALPQVRIPRHAHECPLDFPELVPDPLPGPEFLEDEEGEPVKLFGERAVTVRIDKRIKGKRAKRQPKARKARAG